MDRRTGIRCITQIMLENTSTIYLTITTVDAPGEEEEEEEEEEGGGEEEEEEEEEEKAY